MKPTPPHDPFWSGYTADPRIINERLPRPKKRLTSDEIPMKPKPRRDRVPIWSLITFSEPKTPSLSSLTPKETRLADAASFDARCEADRQLALELRKLRKPIPESSLRPSLLSDEVLAC